MQSVEQLQAKIALLEQENRHLRSRVADLEPHKQKNLRPPTPARIKELFSLFKTKKYALKVCYLGFCYDGMAFQKMTDNNTVEAYIFKAMHTMSLIPEPCIREDYTRAGRTDKGVSAMGNVMSLRLRSNQLIEPKEEHEHKSIDFCAMLNAILPEDIRILACEEVEDDFNARYFCTRRSYKYFFAKNGLNIARMEEAIKDFVGTHNFLNFCKMNLCNTVNFERTIFSAQIVKSEINEVFQTDANEIYYFYFVGNSFLWHQIRFMSSVLFLIGSGREEPTLIRDLLDLQKFPKKPNYPMAPEYPLILENCAYPQIQLNPQERTVLSFYQTFNQIVMRRSAEKTLVINCMLVAQRDLMANAKITEQYFLTALGARKQKILNRGGKTLAMHKCSGRTIDEAKDSLKGKKKELFLKKMKRQEEYEERVRQEQEGGSEAEGDGGEDQEGEKGENREKDEMDGAE